jgi:hypothetical protein
MLQAPPAAQPQFRVVRRQAIGPAVKVSIRPVRPSMLDLRLMGDPWIVDQGAENLALCFNDCQLASLRGLTLEVPSFNRILDRMRHRLPRRRY